MATDASNAYLARLRGRVDRRHIANAVIAVVGAGRVGGHIAWDLARLVPRRMVLVDGDQYADENRSGHILPQVCVGANKATAVASYIQAEIPGIEDVTAVPHNITDATTDTKLHETILDPAGLVIVATDDLAVQRRVALLARSLDLPAIVPGVSEDGSRGEVFLSLTSDLPCLYCFDGYRPVGDRVRGAALVGPDVYPTVQLAFSLSLAVLDRTSREAELLAPLREGGPPPQLFRTWPPGAPELQQPDDGRTEVDWRDGCEGCEGSASPSISLARPPASAAPGMTTVSRDPERAPWQRLAFALRIEDRTPQEAIGIALGVELFFLVLMGASAVLIVVLLFWTASFLVGVYVGLDIRGTGDPSRRP
jgi:molybdopterin/thiamine biosynthesis adenylyltransferase